MPKHSAILDLSFAGLDLETIVGRYRDLENQVQAKAAIEAIELLSEAEYSGDSITIDGEHYIVSYQTSPERAFTLFVVPAKPARSMQVVASKGIASCGYVRQITIHFPAKLRRRAEKALSRAAQEFVRQYRHIEAQFLEEYGRMQNTLFDGLEALLSATMDSEALEQEKAFLCVTSLQSGMYSFHLGYHQVSRVLQKLKRIQTLPMAPVRAVIAFVLEEGRDSFLSEGILTSEHFTSLPFEKIFEIEGVTRTNRVQSFLLGRDMSVLEVCQERNFSLQITCTPQNAKRIMPIIDDFRNDMKERFCANVKHYSIRRGSLASAWRRGQDKKERLSKTIKDVIIEIIVKLGAEIIKG